MWNWFMYMLLGALVLAAANNHFEWNVIERLLDTNYQTSFSLEANLPDAGVTPKKQSDCFPPTVRGEDMLCHFYPPKEE